MDRGGKVMKIEEALKETGKARREIWGEGVFVEVIDSQILNYKGGSYNHECLFTTSDWQPYHEVEEIRPEKEGELWQFNNLFIWCTVRKNEVLEMICAQGKEIEAIDKMNLTIHGENGWTLIYSPDKEVMKKIKGLEDNSVETIEIEDVLWNTNDGFVYPFQEKSAFKWDQLLNGKPIKLIIERPKEGKL
jgi:hypothetical protein